MSEETRCPSCGSDNITPRDFGQACGDCRNYWITPNQQAVRDRANALHLNGGAARG